MAKSLSVPLKNVAKTIRNVASKLAPRDTGNLRNVLRSYNTPERMTKIGKNGSAKIILFFAPPGARYGAYWNSPYGSNPYNPTKMNKDGSKRKSNTYTIRKRYPKHFDYASKAFKSTEVKTAIKNYTKDLGKAIATQLKEAVQQR